MDKPSSVLTASIHGGMARLSGLKWTLVTLYDWEGNQRPGAN